MTKPNLPYWGRFGITWSFCSIPKALNPKRSGEVMTQRGRHRAPGRHARPKNHNVPLRSAIVASAAVLLTGGITAANSSEQAPPYIDVAALVIESTVSYDIKDHSLTSAATSM